MSHVAWQSDWKAGKREAVMHWLLSISLWLPFILVSDIMDRHASLLHCRLFQCIASILAVMGRNRFTQRQSRCWTQIKLYIIPYSLPWISNVYPTAICLALLVKCSAPSTVITACSSSYIFNRQQIIQLGLSIFSPLCTLYNTDHVYVQSTESIWRKL